MLNNNLNLRLQKEQQLSIKKLAFDFFNSSKVFIFGSRTDLQKKGGDIDIYIQTNKKDNILRAKLSFLREFEKMFGEQKVDVLIDNGTKNKEIFEIAKREGIAL